MHSSPPSSSKCDSPAEPAHCFDKTCFRPQSADHTLPFKFGGPRSSMSCSSAHSKLSLCVLLCALPSFAVETASQSLWGKEADQRSFPISCDAVRAPVRLAAARTCQGRGLTACGPAEACRILPHVQSIDEPADCPAAEPLLEHRNIVFAPLFLLTAYRTIGVVVGAFIRASVGRLGAVATPRHRPEPFPRGERPGALGSNRTGPVSR
jgi:hypothetical protein